MAHYGNILEEELKNKVAQDLFPQFDTTPIIGRIDFCVSLPADPLGLNEPESLLWAEAKKGTTHSIEESFIQLILTLGKEHPQDKNLPPAFLGAFDAEKIAFLPYNAVLDVLAQNDFNWNVAPSDHSTKEFKQLQALLSDKLKTGLEIYDYDTDAKELFHFIKHNFHLQRIGQTSHIRINKNNFTHIYQKWWEAVKPTIGINWDKAKKEGIIDADFYLADILSKDNATMGQKLFVLLQNDHYILDRKVNDSGLEDLKKAKFIDGQKAHHQFWNRYSRPPKREYWDDIVNRRDLLVPSGIRKYQGAFFTPPQWVELSQQYLAAELGEDWQDEYYIWDCCAGTGNLLEGLTNKQRIYASTLDKADVQAMKQRIESMNLAARDGKSGANLTEKHVFQFDFLNDPFFDEEDTDGRIIKSKLPKSLQDILHDPQKRSKLVIYINPPYAEAASKQTVTGNGENKTDVAVKHKTYKRYVDKIGIAARELFAQFLIRAYCEIPTAVLAQFSKLKIEQAPNFSGFRRIFRAKPGRNFLVPAETFDNVKGQFPIGFFIWHTDANETFEKTISDVYDAKGNYIGQKTLCAETNSKSINDWIITTRNRTGEKAIGYMSAKGNDFQNTNYNYIINSKSQLPHPRGTVVTDKNLTEIAIYYAVRHCIEPTWLNDRDQFLFPNNGWQTDTFFQSDCLAYTLFSTNIQSSKGVNHWIPFTEAEVDADELFHSHFMSDFLCGRIKQQPMTEDERTAYENDEKNYETGDMFVASTDVDTHVINGTSPVTFSPEAQAVMDAGRKLWHYYYQQSDALPDASFYDIRLHFQGTKTTKSGKLQMNSDSKDETYTTLITTLRQKMKVLAQQIEPKVYEYGFLKR